MTSRTTIPASPALSTYLGLEREAEASDGRPSPDLKRRLDAAWEALSAREVAWLRARTPGEGSHFEESARRRKVLKLLAATPCGGDAAENAAIAEWLEALTPPERGLFAKEAGCNAPSTETWKQLLEAVRARRSVEEAVAAAERRG